MSLTKMMCGTSTTTDLISNVNGLIDLSSSIISGENTALAPKLPDEYTDAVIAADVAKSQVKEISKLSSKLAHIGGIVEQAGAFFPDDRLITAVRPTFGTGNSISATYTRSFLFDGDSFECMYKDNTSSIIIYVDGKRCDQAIVTTTNTGTLKYFKVTFPSAALRRVDISCFNAKIGALYVDQTDTVTPSLNPRKVVVAGDSFTEGAGGSILGSGYVTRLSEISGNFNIVTSGSGGTGYLATNNGRPNLVDRAQADIVDQNPDMVIVAMGINDSLDISSAVESVVTTIRNGLPNAILVLVGSWTAGEATNQMILNTSRIKTVAESLGVYFINPTGTANDDGWITGTGDVASPQNNGNADKYVSADGTHPNDAGHTFHGKRLYYALSSLGLKL